MTLELSAFGLGLAFGGGLVSFLSPCVLPHDRTKDTVTLTEVERIRLWTFNIPGALRMHGGRRAFALRPSKA
jgi:hypothetical protein